MIFFMARNDNKIAKIFNNFYLLQLKNLAVFLFFIKNNQISTERQKLQFKIYGFIIFLISSMILLAIFSAVLMADASAYMRIMGSVLDLRR